MADYNDIITLCRTVDGTQYATEGELMQALEGVLNVDTFLRYIAVTTIIDNWDTYPYTGNNYYLFNNPVSERFEWIPWDLAWGENPQASLFPTASMGIIQRAPLVDQVFSSESYRRQYLAYVDLLLRYWFNERNITDQVEKYHRLIAPYVIQEPGDKAFNGDQPMFPPEAFTNAWQDLISFAHDRNQFLKDALGNESQP
jgi:hypothetical protein